MNQCFRGTYHLYLQAGKGATQETIVLASGRQKKPSVRIPVIQGQKVKRKGSGAQFSLACCSLSLSSRGEPIRNRRWVGVGRGWSEETSVYGRQEECIRAALTRHRYIWEAGSRQVGMEDWNQMGQQNQRCWGRQFARGWTCTDTHTVTEIVTYCDSQEASCYLSGRG